MRCFLLALAAFGSLVLRAQLGPEQVFVRPVEAAAIEAIDLDQDGDDDGLFLADGRIRTMLQGPMSTFHEGTDLGDPVAVYLTLGQADPDNDGAIDVTAGDTTGLRWFRNLGGGLFDTARTVVDGMVPELTRFGDLDGDGDTDAMIGLGQPIAYLQLVENTGGGSFAPPVLVFTGSVSSWNSPGERFHLGDLDSDGDLDVCMLMSDVAWLQNNGGGNFTPITILASPNAYDIHLADIDGDAYRDILLNQNQHTLSWIMNQGGGNFAPPAVLYDIGTGTISRINTADDNSDGDLDLYFIEHWDYCVGKNIHRATNNGSGSFSNWGATAGHGDMVFPLYALGNYDSDAALELLWEADDALYADTRRLTACLPKAIAMEDIDGDGDQDLSMGTPIAGTVICEEWDVMVTQRQLGGNFIQPAVNATSDPMTGFGVNAIRPCRINADTKDDLLIQWASVSGDWSYARAAGNGAIQIVDTLESCECELQPVVADMDNDGDNDIVWSTVLLNSGNGLFFTPIPMPMFGTWFGVGDMNSDGVLDYLATYPQLQWFENDGTVRQGRVKRSPRGRPPRPAFWACANRSIARTSISMVTTTSLSSPAWTW